MQNYLPTSMLLLFLTLVMCCLVYPYALYLEGLLFYTYQASGNRFPGHNEKPLVIHAFPSKPNSEI